MQLAAPPVGRLVLHRPAEPAAAPAVPRVCAWRRRAALGTHPRGQGRAPRVPQAGGRCSAAAVSPGGPELLFLVEHATHHDLAHAVGRGRPPLQYDDLAAALAQAGHAHLLGAGQSVPHVQRSPPLPRLISRSSWPTGQLSRWPADAQHLVRVPLAWPVAPRIARLRQRRLALAACR